MLVGVIVAACFVGVMFQCELLVGKVDFFGGCCLGYTQDGVVIHCWKSLDSILLLLRRRGFRVCIVGLFGDCLHGSQRKKGVGTDRASQTKQEMLAANQG
jgi:hypothetical protein